MTNPVIITVGFKSGGRPGYLRADYEPGRILPRPTERELGHADRYEDLAAWWGGEFPRQPAARAEGKLFPALLVRPASGELYVWLEPHRVRLLRECSRSEQMETVRRCADNALLALVPQCCADNAVRTLVRQRLEAELRASQPVSVEVARGRAVVVLANGAEVATHSYYARDLRPLLAGCAPGVLDALQKSDERPAVQALVEELRNAPPPEPEPEEDVGYNAAEVAEFLGTFPELLTGDQAEAVCTFFEVPDRVLAGWLKDGQVAGAAKSGSARNATWAIPKGALLARIEQWSTGEGVGATGEAEA